MATVAAKRYGLDKTNAFNATAALPIIPDNPLNAPVTTFVPAASLGSIPSIGMKFIASPALDISDPAVPPTD